MKLMYLRQVIHERQYYFLILTLNLITELNLVGRISHFKDNRKSINIHKSTMLPG